ncbi:unnamed protein product, partial [Chrysoparadoxa australica]
MREGLRSILVLCFVFSALGFTQPLLPKHFGSTSLALARRRSEGKGKQGQAGRGGGKRKGGDCLLWRLFNVEMPLHLDPGKDSYEMHEALEEAALA